MKSYRDLLKEDDLEAGELELEEAPRGMISAADLKKLPKKKVLDTSKMRNDVSKKSFADLKKKHKLFSWDQIKNVMMKMGFGAKTITKLASALNKLAESEEILELTTAGQGTGDYHPPLGMSRRDKDKFSSTSSMLKQFDQCVGTMGRKDMLGQCRKMGLSVGHLKNGDIKKTLLGMSVRNKRKFMGVSMGMGMGHKDNRQTDTWK